MFMNQGCMGWACVWLKYRLVLRQGFGVGVVVSWTNIRVARCLMIEMIRLTTGRYQDDTGGSISTSTQYKSDSLCYRCGLVVLIFNKTYIKGTCGSGFSSVTEVGRRAPY